MSSLQNPNSRIVSFYISTRGYGYAVLEGGTVLADSGATTVKGPWLAAYSKLSDLLNRYRPEIVVMQDMADSKSRRSERIQKVGEAVEQWLALWGYQVAKITREDARLALLNREDATKWEIAEKLISLFPGDLEHRKPRFRKIWMSEDRKMDVFDAVALAVAFNERQKN